MGKPRPIEAPEPEYMPTRAQMLKTWEELGSENLFPFTAETARRVLDLAIERAKVTARRRGIDRDSYFKKWECHDSSIHAVLDEIRKIIKELNIYLPQNLAKFEAELGSQLSRFNVSSEFSGVGAPTVIDDTDYANKKQ